MKKTGLYVHFYNFFVHLLDPFKRTDITSISGKINALRTQKRITAKAGKEQSGTCS